LLVQDSGDEDCGFAMSLWDNLADMEAYEQSAQLKEFLATLERYFVGEFLHSPDARQVVSAAGTE
jgi:hypothetical protein